MRPFPQHVFFLCFCFSVCGYISLCFEGYTCSCVCMRVEARVWSRVVAVPQPTSFLFFVAHVYIFGGLFLKFTLL